MAYITSRGFLLPRTAVEMDDSIWFNLWRKKLWPYHLLQPGDQLYWYESPSKRICGDRVPEVEAFSYSDLDFALDRLDAAFGVTIIDVSPILTASRTRGSASAIVSR